MADPMTTPPLDLPALREYAKELERDGARSGTIRTDVLRALLNRVEEESERADRAAKAVHDQSAIIERLTTRAEAAERDLAAVTVSRDGWQPRAEAAEKKVAAAIDWCDTNQHPFHPSEGAVGFSRQDWALNDAARRVRTMLTTPETETTP